MTAEASVTPVGPQDPVAQAPLTPPPAAHGLRSLTTRAVAWSGVGSLGTQVLTVAFSVVLSRLLRPSDFGVMALVTVATGLTWLLCEAGFATTIAMRREVDEEVLSSAFWLQIGIGAVGSVVLLGLSPLVAAFYRQPRIGQLLLVLSVGPLVSAVGAVPRAILVRQMQFRLLSLVDLVSLTIAGAASVTVAALFHSVWALAVMALVTQVVTALGRLLIVPWRPAFSISRRAVRAVTGFSRSVYGYQILTFLTRNADNVMVGRILGTSQLGLYTRSYTLLLFPTQRISAVVGSAVQVALSRISLDKERSRRVYSEACQTILFVTAPLMLGLAVMAKPVVLVLFGHQWVHMWPTATVLCLVALVEPLTTTTGWIFLAQQRPELNVRLQMVAAPALLGGVACGLAGGSAFTAALGYAVGSLSIGPLFLKRAVNLLDMRLIDFATRQLPTVACAVASCLVMLGIRMLWHAPAALVVVVCGAAGTLTYLALSAATKLPGYVAFRRRFDGFRRRRAA